MEGEDDVTLKLPVLLNIFLQKKDCVVTLMTKIKSHEFKLHRNKNLHIRRMMCRSFERRVIRMF